MDSLDEASAVPDPVIRMCSTAGMALASASGFVAIFVLAYAPIVGFPFYDPLLMRIYGLGILALVALVSSVGEMWRANPVRRLAPARSLGMLVFGIISMAGE